MNLQEISIRQSAIVSGVAILIMAVAAVIATEATIGGLLVKGDPPATFNNIQSNLGLFRTGVVGWVVILICDVIAAWGLYVFLRPVNKDISLIGGWLRMVYSAILGTAILKLSEVLVAMGAMNTLKLSDSNQLTTQVYLAVDGFYAIWSIGLIVFGLHIFVLGYLAVCSGYVPKLLGNLLLVGAVGYFFVHLLKLLIPQYADVIQIIEYIFILPMLSEVAFGIWLLIKGTRVQIEENSEIMS